MPHVPPRGVTTMPNPSHPITRCPPQLLPPRGHGEPIPRCPPQLLPPRGHGDGHGAPIPRCPPRDGGHVWPGQGRFDDFVPGPRR